MGKLDFNFGLSTTYLLSLMTNPTTLSLLGEQTAPASETGTTMTGTRTQARTKKTTTERRHDAPPDKTHGEPKPAVAMPFI